MKWRDERERQFQFDPSKPVDSRDLIALDKEFAQKAAALQGLLLAGPQTLRQSLSVWKAQRLQALVKVTASTQRLAKADVNRRALRWF